MRKAGLFCSKHRWRGITNFSTKIISAGLPLYDVPSSSSLDRILKLADKKKKEFAAKDKNIRDSLEQYLQIRLNYTSNALEGNSLTEQDVFSLLQTGGHLKEFTHL